ncbi:MAG: hypothetical protein Q4A00_05860 [Flavobacteriaceae bacterium]|nr:hypothetical protein [Flavobacteriaceae bacterium]
MRKFIAKIILFGVILLGVLGGVYYCWFSQPKPIVKIQKRNIIIGDSNTRWSIDDKILKDYANYSTGGELYIFAYRKLKILNEHNKIDTLLLSFSPHNLINNGWWVDDGTKPVENRMPSFYLDYSKEEHLDFFKSIPKSYIRSILKIGDSKFRNLFSMRRKFEWGGVNNDMFRFGSYIPSYQNELQLEFKFIEYKTPKITKEEVKYIKKIIEECKEKGIHLILIQPPKNYLRKDYKNYMHPEFYEYYNEHFSAIDFLDFSELQLPPHAYCDMMHVDIVGAEYFSNFLNNNGIGNLLKSNYNLKNRIK